MNDDQQTVRRLAALARMLDSSLGIPGTRIRFGLDAIIGLIPGIGDTVTALISLYIVNEARRLGVPRYKIARMLANVGIDAVIGAVPLLGDIFDVAWKANRRNVKILGDHVQGRIITLDHDEFRRVDSGP